MTRGQRHRAAGLAYYPLRAANQIARLTGRRSSDRLRVILHHDVPPWEEARFAAQLRWLARTWHFVAPDEFAAMVSGEAPIRGANALLCFDDGFASNRAVAERVLNPLGIRALFFVVADLVAMADRDAGRRFMGARLGFALAPDAVPASWGHMTWSDLEALLEQGHTIGGHTATHARLSELASVADLHREIVASADQIAERLGAPIDHFSYTFGDLASVNEPAIAMAHARFRFVYSGLRGDNAGAPRGALRRDACATQDARYDYLMFDDRYVGALLEGAADANYRADLETLDRWAR